MRSEMSPGTSSCSVKWVHHASVQSNAWYPCLSAAPTRRLFPPPLWFCCSFSAAPPLLQSAVLNELLCGTSCLTSLLAKLPLPQGARSHVGQPYQIVARQPAGELSRAACTRRRVLERQKKCFSVELVLLHSVQ